MILHFCHLPFDKGAKMIPDSSNEKASKWRETCISKFLIEVTDKNISSGLSNILHKTQLYNEKLSF